MPGAGNDAASNFRLVAVAGRDIIVAGYTRSSSNSSHE
jgi:hypothetical protein